MTHLSVARSTPPGFPEISGFAMGWILQCFWRPRCCHAVWGVKILQPFKPDHVVSCVWNFRIFFPETKKQQFALKKGHRDTLYFSIRNAETTPTMGFSGDMLVSFWVGLDGIGSRHRLLQMMPMLPTGIFGDLPGWGFRRDFFPH